ncbi:MAG TPA: pitrilysin family protein, partial [Pyrinomonadaceae bacterium]|nr:pitrilysin family protein [Pyrinomonadaceae bacterium]
MKNNFRKVNGAHLVFCLALFFAASVFEMRAAAQGEQPPPPAPPRSVKFPQPVEKTLKNNLRVIVISRPESMPLVTIKAIIKTGGEADPAGLAGLADTTAELLKQGTTTRTAPQIAEAIEALGGSLETGAGWDAATADVDVINTKTAAAMEILADVVRRPSFAPEEIDRLRQQTLDELSVALSQPGTLARFVASRVLYGDAPYAHPIGGTPESIARIKRADIVSLHAKYYRPDNAILVIG